MYPDLIWLSNSPDTLLVSTPRKFCYTNFLAFSDETSEFSFRLRSRIDSEPISVDKPWCYRSWEIEETDEIWFCFTSVSLLNTLLIYKEERENFAAAYQLS